MSKISEIDKNFKIETNLNLDDVVYYNVKENPWCLFGVLNEDVFRRIPKEIARQVNAGVYPLHTNTSGGRLRFVTDSPYVAIFAKMPDKTHFSHMPQTGISGFDAYVDNRFFGAFIPPVDMENGSFNSVVYFNNNVEKNLMIHMPLYNNVSDLYVGIKKGSTFKKAEDYKNKGKVVYYGSSITQGGCVSRPGLSYPAVIARELDCDFINLGFSGSAKGETVMAEYIAKLNPSIFVFDYDHNAETEEQLQATHESFYKTFRSICPKTKVVMISAPNFKYKYINWDSRREIIKKTYNNAIASGDQNVYFIDGETLWGEEIWDSCTVDGTHPNDLGHFKMAEAIILVLKKIMK